MPLPEVGLSAVIANLPKFEQGAKAIQQAYTDINTKADAVGKVTERMGLKFDEASNRWRTTSGKFATNAEVAAAGINKAKDAADRTGKSFIDLGGIAGKAGGQLVGLGSTMLSIGAIAGGVALAGVLALGAGLATFATVGINKAIDLDAQMATIAATMNTTKEAVGPLKDLILDLALDPNLTVNTTQAADAIQLLAQNGVTMTEIMDGAAAATVALANATGAQFSTAADIASGVMKVFNIDAADMETAIDGITGVVNTSKFTIEDFGQAFAAAGGIAAEIGVSFEDFSAVIAGTATNFNSGSDAGTSFKTFLQRLSNPTDENRDLMEKYGISLFDSAGNMRDMRDVVGQLHGVFGDLTQAQKAELAAQIGGADASRTVLALAGMSVEEFDKLSANVNDTGQAFRSAATRVDSVKGAFEIFRGIVEAVQIQVGDKFLPILRDITVGFTDLASKVGPTVVDFFGGIADTIASMMGKVRGLIDIFGEKGLAGVFAALGLKGSALFFKKLTELGGKLGFLGEGATTFSDILKNNLGAAFTWLGDNAFPILSDGLTEINSFIDTAKELISAFMEGGLFGGTKDTPGGTVATGGLLAALGLDNISGQLAELAGQIISGIPGALTSVLSSIATFLTDNWPIISDSLSTWTTNFWDWAKNAADGAGEAMAAVSIAILAWAFSPEAQSSTNELGQNLGRMITDGIKNFFIGAEGGGTVLGSLATGLLVGAGAIIGTLIILGGEIVAGILSGILEAFGIDLQPTTFSELSAILTGIGTNIKTIAKVIGTNIVTSIKQGWDSMVETVVTAFQEGVDSWTAIIVETDWAELGESILDGVLKGLKDNASKVLEYLKGLLGQDAVNFVMAAIKGGSPALAYVPIGVSMAQGITAGITQGAPGITTALGNITRGTIDSLLGVTRGLASNRNAIGAARDDIEKYFDNAKLGGTKTAFALSVLSRVFRDNEQAILGATDRAAKFKELANSAINWEKAGFSGDPGKILQAGIGLWINAFDKRKAELLRAKQQMFIEAGKTALSIGTKLNDIIQGSVDVLDQRVQTLQELVNSGLAQVNFEGQIISAVQAQELLNTALAEQRDIQDDILQLRQNEQKLGFLEKQLALIDTLNQAGLNVKDILGGITLGLDASIPDMIEATNRLVMAMIDQVNEDLQLGSPSKVMMKKGIQTGQGFVEGLMAQMPNIANAMRQAIAGPALVNGPALSGGSSSRVVNNNFNMSVNSGASAQNVMAQFEIARAMA